MKYWFKSKTIWINLIAVIALAIQTQYGYAISLENQAIILVVVNMILRVITKEEIVWEEIEE